jgi:proteasome beta subunit
MSREETVDLALRALFAAADEDTATGGPDLIRRIYPMVAVIGATGYAALDDATVAERSEALYGGREEGSGL